MSPGSLQINDFKTPRILDLWWIWVSTQTQVCGKVKASKKQNVGLFTLLHILDRIYIVNTCCTINWAWTKAEYEPQNLI